MHQACTLSTQARAALDAGDVAALIALHRAEFGGYVMEGEGADPAAPGTDPAAPPADPATPPADPADPDPGTDPEGDPDGDPNDPDPRVRRANRQAAQYRTERNELRSQVEGLQTQVTETTGLLQRLAAAITGEDPNANPEVDPAEALATVTSEAESLRTENTDLRASLLVHELTAPGAPAAGANVTALLDSQRFTSTLRGLDPAADNYRDQVAQAINAAVEQNPTLRTPSQGPGRGGAEDAGGAEQNGETTPEQFRAMSYGERTALFAKNPALYRRLASTAK